VKAEGIKSGLQSGAAGGTIPRAGNDEHQLDRIKIFHDSAHATNRRIERGVTFQAMKDVIIYHDKKTQQRRGNHGGMVYRFSKTVSPRSLVVVAEVKKAEAWLVSCFEE
jgi:hypothetical protein